MDSLGRVSEELGGRSEKTMALHQGIFNCYNLLKSMASESCKTRHSPAFSDNRLAIAGQCECVFGPRNVLGIHAAEFRL